MLLFFFCILYDCLSASGSSLSMASGHGDASGSSSEEENSPVSPPAMPTWEEGSCDHPPLGVLDPEGMLDGGPGFEGKNGDGHSVSGRFSSGIPTSSGCVFFFLSIFAFCS
jgi:hypothetical protein